MKTDSAVDDFFLSRKTLITAICPLKKNRIHGSCVLLFYQTLMQYLTCLTPTLTHFPRAYPPYTGTIITRLLRAEILKFTRS